MLSDRSASTEFSVLDLKALPGAKYLHDTDLIVIEPLMPDEDDHHAASMEIVSKPPTTCLHAQIDAK